MSEILALNSTDLGSQNSYEFTDLNNNNNNNTDIIEQNGDLNDLVLSLKIAKEDYETELIETNNTKEANSSSNESVLLSGSNKELSNDQACEEPDDSNNELVCQSSDRNIDLENLEETNISNFINGAIKFGANAIDLSRKALNFIPKDLNKLENLQFLYLESNKLSELPLDFFAVFRQLQWLDLRNNDLTELPTYELATHENLRYILLENNKINALPVELAYVANLAALNLYNNPIEFPPITIIQKGLKAIKEFLKENDELNKVNNKIENIRYEKDVNDILNDVWDSNNEDDEYNEESNIRRSSSCLKKNRKSSANIILDRQSTCELAVENISEKYRASLLPVKIMKSELKIRLERAKIEANNLRTKNSKPAHLSTISFQKSNKDGLIYRNYELENALKTGKTDKYMKNKQFIDSKIQKIKDKETADEFRDELKIQQRKLKFKRLIRGIDYVEPVQQAPFGIDDDHMIMMTNEEREILDAKLKAARTQPLSPETLMRIEEERRMRDHILQQKIRDYTKKLLARRNAPKDNPKKDRLEAAKDLKELKSIEKELEQRRADIQFRYQAYTGDLRYIETAKLNATGKAINFLPLKQK